MPDRRTMGLRVYRRRRHADHWSWKSSAAVRSTWMHPDPGRAADDISTAVFNRLSVARDRRRSLVVPRTRKCTVLSTVMSCYSFADSKVRSRVMADPLLRKATPPLRPRHRGRCVGLSAAKRRVNSECWLSQHIASTTVASRVKRKMKISGAQVTAARNLLRITQEELAAGSGVSEETVRRFEADHTLPQRATLAKILSELERRGIEFTNGNHRGSPGDGIGVRLNLDKAATFARLPDQRRKKQEP